MQVDVAVSSASDLRGAIDCLRWVGGLRIFGAALVALGVGLELLGELLGHSSEQTLRSAREAEIAGLVAQVETLRRATPALPAFCETGPTLAEPALQTEGTPIQACPLPRDGGL